MAVYIHSHDLQTNKTEILVLMRPLKDLLFLSLLEFVTEDLLTLTLMTILPKRNVYKNELTITNNNQAP